MIINQTGGSGENGEPLSSKVGLLEISNMFQIGTISPSMSVESTNTSLDGSLELYYDSRLSGFSYSATSGAQSRTGTRYNEIFQYTAGNKSYYSGISHLFTNSVLSLFNVYGQSESSPSMPTNTSYQSWYGVSGSGTSTYSRAYCRNIKLHATDALKAAFKYNGVKRRIFSIPVWLKSGYYKSAVSNYTSTLTVIAEDYTVESISFSRTSLGDAYLESIGLGFDFDNVTYTE